MARGWDSKAVEDQVQERQELDSSKRRPQVTPAQAESHRRREVLILSRTRVQRDLEASSNQRYRDQLTHALVDIESQLADLEDVS
jgi:hypothetical protein